MQSVKVQNKTPYRKHNTLINYLASVNTLFKSVASICESGTQLAASKCSATSVCGGCSIAMGRRRRWRAAGSSRRPPYPRPAGFSVAATPHHSDTAICEHERNKYVDI